MALDSQSAPRAAVPSGTEDIQTLRWYLIQCKPRQEERAVEHLQRQRFECYYPVRRAVKHHPSGRKYTTSEALFPGYLFIRLNRVHDNWHAIHSTRGVSRVVRFNEYVPAVEDELIEEIRARLAGPEAEKPYLRPGERVSIVEGAFAHFEAIFICDTGEERVVLLLNILQQEQRLHFPLSSVRKLA